MTSIDADLIRESLAGLETVQVESLDVFDTIESTNSYLCEMAAATSGRCRVAVADHQTAGRGRRDNRWISAPGRSLCLSISYGFARLPENLSALTLALGVAVAEALGGIGARNVRLKWPNDLVAADAKLGGILIESQIRNADEFVVVAGVGLNLLLPDRIEEGLQAPMTLRAIDLRSLLTDMPSRERLAVLLIEACGQCFIEFDRGGFDDFIERFAALDWLAGKRICISNGGDDIRGRADGIDESGALRVETSAGLTTVISGTVTAVAS
jgi:BirA family biotin operon repressor/biotin-[acetyl-CoA-carboxylase] ligase